MLLILFRHQVRGLCKKIGQIKGHPFGARLDLLYLNKDLSFYMMSLLFSVLICILENIEIDLLFV